MKHRGLVVSIGSRSAQVFIDGLGEQRCVVRGNLYKQNTIETKPVAVGDHVVVEIGSTTADDAAIVEIEERKNQLARRAAGSRKHVGRGVHGVQEFEGGAKRRGGGRGRAVKRGRDGARGTHARGRRQQQPDDDALSDDGKLSDANERIVEGATSAAAGMGGGRGGARVRGQARVQVLAANIDRLIVVAAAADPPFRPGLVDRFLVAARDEGIDALVCVNKIDLEAEIPELRRVAKPYHDAGVAVLETSIVTGENIDALRDVMSQGVNLLVGHSGVGKSSLLNAVSPELALEVGRVTDYHGRGRHTTTRVTLLPLDSGGWVIDSPGIREFVLDNLTATEVARLFPGFNDLPLTCRFNDCLHQEEPGCAIVAAVESDDFDSERYIDYLRVLEDLA